MPKFSQLSNRTAEIFYKPNHNLGGKCCLELYPNLLANIYFVTRDKQNRESSSINAKRTNNL